MMGVYGRRCLRSGCRGRVAFKVTQYSLLRILEIITDRSISTPTLSYTTSYYTSCLSLMPIKPSTPLKIPTLVVRYNPNSFFFFRPNAFLTLVSFHFIAQFSDIVTKNAVLLDNLGRCVEKHLNNCGRRWVDLKTLFSLMKV